MYLMLMANCLCCKTFCFLFIDACCFMNASHAVENQTMNSWCTTERFIRCLVNWPLCNMFVIGIGCSGLCCQNFHGILEKVGRFQVVFVCVSVEQGSCSQAVLFLHSVEKQREKRQIDFFVNRLNIDWTVGTRLHQASASTLKQLWWR